MYKKYITKKGRKVGPYYYDSIRLKNGKVKSVYLGANLKNAKKKLSLLKKESSKSVHKRSSATLKKNLRPKNGFLNPRRSTRIITFPHNVTFKERIILSVILLLILFGFIHFGGLLQ